MGLDVYVGSLTRYYSRNWKTRAQQWGEQEGLRVVVVHPYESQDAITDPAPLREIVLQWRDYLNEELKGVMPVALDWPEEADSPYFTDKPGWTAYGDLLIWAAYEETGRSPRPKKHVEAVADDPAIVKCRKKGSRSRYGQLLCQEELWLPADFAFGFEAQDPTGADVRMGSSVALLRQLDELNRRTWKLNESEIAACGDGDADATSLESGARFAFAVFWSLTKRAVEHRLPMKLDY